MESNMRVRYTGTRYIGLTEIDGFLGSLLPLIFIVAIPVAIGGAIWVHWGDTINETLNWLFSLSYHEYFSIALKAWFFFSVVFVTCCYFGDDDRYRWPMFLAIIVMIIWLVYAGVYIAKHDLFSNGFNYPLKSTDYRFLGWAGFFASVASFGFVVQRVTNKLEIYLDNISSVSIAIWGGVAIFAIWLLVSIACIIWFSI